MASDKDKPWERNNPKPASKRSHLTAAQITAAKARAEAAGRRYPNLVDNMWATKQTLDKRTGRKPSR